MLKHALRYVRSMVPLLVGVFGVCGLGVQVTMAANYYVDTASLGGACSDVASGTALGSPWCTIQKAANTAVAGDTVYVRGGTYREVVTPANSGTAGNVITYTKYASEVPVVTGSLVSNFSSLGDGETGVGSIFYDGFESNDPTFSKYNSGTGVTLGGGNTMLVQSAVKNNGQYAVAASFMGTDRNARLVNTITGSSTDVYQRMYFRINSGYDITANDTGQIIMNLRIDSGTSRGAVELLQNAGGQFYLRGRAINPTGGSNLVIASTTPGSIVPDTWYLVELRYKGGDAVTGGAELWLNGSSAGSNYTLNTSTTTIGRIEFGGGTSGTGVAASGSVLYMDDINVGTSSRGAFSAGSPNVYRMSGVTSDPNLVYANGNLLATTTGYVGMAAGSFYYDDADDAVYVRMSDNSAPGTTTVDVPNRVQGFNIASKSYLTVNGFTVRYMRNQGVLDGGITMATSSYITISNNIVTDNFGAGVYLLRTSSSTISGNQFLRNHREFGGGIRLENGSDNNLILNNTVTGLGLDAGNGLNFCGDSGCGNVGNNYNIIRGNTFYNLRDSCAYIGSISDYNIYEKNICGLTYRADGVGGTGYHVSRGSDYNIARNNIFYDIYGASILVQSNTLNSVITPVYGNQILNNVIYNSGTSLVGNHGGISVTERAYNTLIRNNIIFEGNDVSGIRVTGEAATSTDSDYNLYYSTQPTATHMMNWSTSSGIYYDTLADFRVVYPTQEVHSISVNPLFTNAAAHDFTVATNSPAIDAGTTTSGVTDDYLAVARPQGLLFDMGIYESALVTDAVAPVISAVASTSGTSSATVTWTTNEPADSQVNYGLTTAYGATTTLDAALVTSHSVVIGSLAPSTIYNFRVRSTDGSGNAGVSTNYTVQTTSAPDVTSPSVAITAPGDGNTIAGALVTVSASATDNVAVAGVQFRVNGVAIGSEDTSAPYTAVLDSTLLTDGVSSLIAVVRDTSNNVATSSPVSVTVDNTAAIISAIASSTSNTTATVTWTTNEPADSQVVYGTSLLYGATTTLDSLLVTNHTVGLSGLTANTLYYFKIRTTDAVGNLRVSADGTFRTTAVADVTAPGISVVTADTTDITATVTWVTDEVADSQVDYGVFGSYTASSTLATALSTNHSIVLTGLTASTTYQYRVRSSDAALNLATSTVFTFTTSPAVIVSSGGGGGGGGGSKRLTATTTVTTTSTTTGTTTVPGTTTTLPVSVPTVIVPPSLGAYRFKSAISFMQPQGNDPQAVTQLQQFLNTFESAALALDGRYDADDLAAIKRFQLKYASQILSVWGLSEATGYVGLTTRLKMNSLLAGQVTVCPAFTEFNGGKSGIMYSPEIGQTQAVLRELDMYTGPINNSWDGPTVAALKKFQVTFKEVMLKPWGLTEGTGYKYKTTNKFLNYFVGCQTSDVDLDGQGTFNF